MPRYGGGSPYPLQYGGGPAKPNQGLLQVVWSSIANQRGTAYDQVWPPRTLVGIENMAYARAITFDLFGANTRLANNFLPSKMTAQGGLLSRWETIFDVPPLPGDSDPARRTRVGAAFAKVGSPNSTQPFIDVLNSTLGPLYVGVTHFTPTNALSWWPGNSGTAAAITGLAAPNVTATGLTNVPSAAYGNTITFSNCTIAANNGSFPITAATGTSATALNPAGSAPDYGVGGTVAAPTIRWSITNPFVYWSSSIDSVDIQVDPTVAGYHNADGSVNGTFWAALNACAAQLDAMLPSWIVWRFWYSTGGRGGGMGFFLDTINNLDLEAFGH